MNKTKDQHSYKAYNHDRNGEKYTRKRKTIIFFFSEISLLMAKTFTGNMTENAKKKKKLITSLP